MAQIYTWRAEGKLGVSAITRRLNACPAAYPPADPAAGWSLGGVAAILHNTKYTGYQVFCQFDPANSRHRPQTTPTPSPPARTSCSPS